MSLADLERGLFELSEAEDDYHDAEMYYEGRNPEQWGSIRLARTLRAYENKFRLRLAKVPVDVVSDRLTIAAVTVNTLQSGGEDQGEEPVSDQDKALSAVLQDQVRDANDMDVEEGTVMHTASEYGDAYVIVDYDEVANRVSLYCNNPTETRIIYDSTGRYKLFGIKVWTELDEDNEEFLRATLFYSNAIEEYRTAPGDDGADLRDWFPLGDGSPFTDEQGRILVDELGQPITEPGVYPFDFGQIPVFHFRNGKPYGRPEHEAAYGPQDMIDKLVITQMATVDFQGFPQRYALQDPQAMTAADQAWEDDDADAATTSEPTNNLKAGPGEVWFLDGVKQAGQFDVASADAFLKPLTRYARAMSTVTKTPFHLFDDEGQPPTGESRRTAEGSLTKMVQRRQRQYGASWRELYAYCLSLLTGEDVTALAERIEVRWEPAESIDPSEVWDLALKKKTVGMPMAQILAEAGYSADDIAALMTLADIERREQIELQREQFQASMQERRPDRPNRPNPDAPPSKGDGE